MGVRHDRVRLRLGLLAALLALCASTTPALGAVAVPVPVPVPAPEPDAAASRTEPLPETGVASAGPRAFQPVEASIATVHAAFRSGQLQVTELVRFYLDRIARHDDGSAGLNSIAALSNRVLEEAGELDRRLAQDGVPAAQPLFGIPLIVKDNIETGHLPVTAGSALLEGFTPGTEATLVRRLRAAGALVLGTANMHEFAYGIESVGSVFGAVRNPYDRDRHPGGSSGGTAAAVSASLALAGIGTDTCGSVRNPAGHTALVGVRGTQGLVSRAGIVPLSLTQDIAGPLARSVADAARILSVVTGFDAADPQTARSVGHHVTDYHAALGQATLAGKRFGVVRQLVAVEPADAEIARVFEQAVADLRAAGAVVIDIEPLPLAELVYAVAGGFYVLSRDFARDIDGYLTQRPQAPVRSLVEIVADGRAHPAVQPLLLGSLTQRSDAPGLYLAELAKRQRLRDALLFELTNSQLDALIYPNIRQPASPLGTTQGGSNCHLSANSGLPALTVPMGYTAGGLPAGLELLGAAWSEAKLLALAHAYEQRTRHRRPPPLR